MHKITIPQTITLSYDGTEQQFIDNADRLSRNIFEEGLDSLDSGDATGLYLRLLLELSHDEDDPLPFIDGTTLYYERSTELFTHEGDWAK